MNYFLDTEFYENGTTVQLISIAIVCEDGRELYCENSDFQWDAVPAGHWIRDNVKPHLFHRTDEGRRRGNVFERDGGVGGLLSKQYIQREVERFVKEESSPRFWGYFADYDWVAFCQLFGTMMLLPAHFPKFCMDLKQSMAERGLTGEWKRIACPDPVDEHHALADGRWNRDLYRAINQHVREHAGGILLPA